MSDFDLFGVDGRTVSWQLANQLARVRVDSLRNDIVQARVLKPADCLGPAQIPALADYEALRAKIDVFERRVLKSTRQMYLSLLSNPRYKVFCIRDLSRPGLPKVVGIAEWQLPHYAPPLFETNLLAVLRVKWLQFWYRILDFFDPGTSVTAILAEYAEAADLQGLSAKADEFVAEYGSTEYTPETIPLYPHDMAYYLNVFGIRTDYQGRKLGRTLLEYSRDQLNTIAQKPPMLDHAPAKLEWQSAPLAWKFYEKVGAIGCPPVRTKRGLDHRAFFLDLPTS